MTNNNVQESSVEASLLYHVPDALIWVTPVTNGDGTVYDFEVQYANKAAMDAVGHPKGDLNRLWILRDGIPSDKGAEANFRHFLDVFHSGEVKEYEFTSHYTNRRIETIRRPHNGGVVSITRDRGAQREAEQREKATSRTMESIVKASPTGIAAFEAVRDDDNNIVDFKVKVCNEQRNRLLGLTEEEGKTLSLRRLLHILDSDDVYNQYVEVVENDVFVQREQYIRRSNKWISISVVKLDDGILAMLFDITEMKLSQQVLKEQSDYLSSILNASLDAVCTCEAIRDAAGEIIDLRYTQINRMYEQMIGKTEAEVLGKTMTELFPTAVKTGVFSTHCNVIKTGISARFDLRYQGEGLDAWFDISSVKVGDNGVVITFADVMEQKTAVEKIEEQKKLLDKILVSSSNAISVTRFIRNEQDIPIDCIGILANDAAIRISGIPKEDYLVKSVLDIEPSMIESDYFKKCVQTLETGEPFVTQYFFELTQRWLELSVSRMDRDHLIHIFTDVTDIKEVQLQRDKLLEELKRSNQSLEQFAHAASHDMKEPLRKIRIFTERLKSQMMESSEQQDLQLVHRIETAAERLQLLIDDLLEFSHVNERPHELDTVDLNEKVKKVLSDLDLPVEETGTRVIVENLPTIKGNKRQIQQLFYNLISNAIKYRRPDTPPEITIRSRTISGSEVPADVDFPGRHEQQKFHLIEVHDNGIGFKQKYAHQIFRMFQRLHGKNEYAGTGVGLSIAQRVVEHHNGYIWATSETGVGSAFNILLPITVYSCKY